jgi:hypothetical protein
MAIFISYLIPHKQLPNSIFIVIFAEGDWSFQAFIRKAWKKYPENPVNPVKKEKI